jgi:hypothetical protein
MTTELPYVPGGTWGLHPRGCWIAHRNVIITLGDPPVARTFLRGRVFCAYCPERLPRGCPGACAPEIDYVDSCSKWGTCPCFQPPAPLVVAAYHRWVQRAICQLAGDARRAQRGKRGAAIALPRVEEQGEN